MITHRRLAGRTVVVIAITVFVLAAAPSTLAQDSHNAPWWTGLPAPTPETKATLLRNVQGVAASSFDPKLPPHPIDAWVFAALASRVEVLRSRLVEWDVEFCGAYVRHANPTVGMAPGPELCAKGTVQVSAERHVQIVVLVAEAVRGSLEWRPTSPSLREVYIERVNDGFGRLDSLDVPELSGLADLLQTPFEQWPKVDFESQITWDPPMPLPGETVRVSISVRNTGKRSADRAWVNIRISPCCDNHLEVSRDWLPHLAPGQSARLDLDVPLPEGRAVARVFVRVAPSTKMVRETLLDIDKRPTEAAIGFSPRLLQAVIRFEVRLAETHAAAGMREARVAGSDQLVYLHQDIIVASGDIERNLVVQGDGPSHFGVAVEFKAAGAEKMREATASHIDGLVAILLNGDVVAVLKGPVSASAVIRGDYSRAEAERLASGSVQLRALQRSPRSRRR